MLLLFGVLLIIFAACFLPFMDPFGSDPRIGWAMLALVLIGVLMIGAQIAMLVRVCH